VLISKSGSNTIAEALVRGLPMIVVIDKFGVVRKVNRGYHENFHLEISQLLRQLVKEDKPLQN